MDTFNILTFAEEQKLSTEERIKYIKCLREYLINTPHEGLSKGSLTFCPKINPFVRSLLTKFCGYDIEVEYECDINGLTAIYAHTHQSKMDHVNLIASNPNHTILLNSIVLSEIYKKVLRINGVYFMDKFNKTSKAKAKLEMMRLLLNEKAITMFPESAWCLSPNKLHLPLYNGIVDIARKTGSPIVPVVQEYTYDETKMDGIERIIKAKIRYGSPIYVSETDDLYSKLSEYSDWIATTRWNLIEEKGIVLRDSVTNEQYTNYLKGNIRNLEKAKISINDERNGLFGAKDYFYLQNPINDIQFTEADKTLSKKPTKKLEKI